MIAMLRTQPSPKRVTDTYRDKILPHAPLSLQIVLTDDLVTLLHAFPARKTLTFAIVWLGAICGIIESSAAALRCRDVARRVFGITANVNAGAGVGLSLAIWGKDFDGFVDARDSEKRFIWVTWTKQMIRRRKS